MANSRRAGRQGTFILLAIQERYGDHKTDGTDYIPFRFSPTLLRLDPDGEQARSATIVSGGSDSLNIPGLLTAGGRWEGEMLPQLLPYLLVGAFNPTTTPTSVLLAETAIQSATAYTAGTAIDDFDSSATKKHEPDEVDGFRMPAPVEFTFSAALTEGMVRLEGFRQTARPDRRRRKFVEMIPITGQTVVSKTHVREITSFTVTGAANGTAALKFVPDRYKTTLKINDTSEQFAGYSCVYGKGGRAGTAFDVIPNLIEFRFSNEMRFAADLIASFAEFNRLPADIHTEVLGFPSTGGQAAFQLSEFPEPQLNFFPSWGRALTIGDDTEPTALNDLTIRVNNNYVAPEGATGDIYAGQPEVGGEGFRQTTLDFETPFISGSEQSDTFKRWQELYLDNKQESFEMRSYNYLSNGEMFLIQINHPRFQLTEFPNIDVDTPAQINRRIAGKCVPSEGAVAPDEIEVIIWDKNQYPQA